MNESADDPKTDRNDDSNPDQQDSEQSTSRWLLGCLGKALLIFIVVVLLVFGACLVMIS